jgi:hypothetical protein
VDESAQTEQTIKRASRIDSALILPQSADFLEYGTPLENAAYVDVAQQLAAY